MNWKELLVNLSCVLLGLMIPSLVIFIYKKIGQPISEYVVNRNIRIKEDEYKNIYNENEKLIKEIKKLQIVIKKKGDKK